MVEGQNGGHCHRFYPIAILVRRHRIPEQQTRTNHKQSYHNDQPGHCNRSNEEICEDLPRTHYERPKIVVHLFVNDGEILRKTIQNFANRSHVEKEIYGGFKDDGDQSVVHESTDSQAGQNLHVGSNENYDARKECHTENGSRKEQEISFLNLWRRIGPALGQVRRGDTARYEAKHDKVEHNEDPNAASILQIAPIRFSLHLDLLILFVHNNSAQLFGLHFIHHITLSLFTQNFSLALNFIIYNIVLWIVV